MSDSGHACEPDIENQGIGYKADKAHGSTGGGPSLTTLVYAIVGTGVAILVIAAVCESKPGSHIRRRLTIDWCTDWEALQTDPDEVIKNSKPLLKPPTDGIKRYGLVISVAYQGSSSPIPSCMSDGCRIFQLLKKNHFDDITWLSETALATKKWDH